MATKRPLEGEHRGLVDGDGELPATCTPQGDTSGPESDGSVRGDAPGLEEGEEEEESGDDEEEYETDDDEEDEDVVAAGALSRGERRRSYTCEMCGKSYGKPAKLAQHMRSHTGERPYVCPVPDCGRSYMRKGHLDRHLNSQSHEGWKGEGHEVKIYRCDVPGCNKQYYNQSHLSRHRKAHAVPLPHVCPSPGCGKAYAKRSQLRQHLAVVHEGGSVYSCSVCQKSFAVPAQLEKHAKTHEPRKCPIEGCGAVVPSWKEMRRHLAQHRRAQAEAEAEADEDEVEELSMEERKTFKCDHPGCDRSFTMKKNLVAHQRANHGESRPFACAEPGCGKAFGYKQVLERHIAKCHGSRPAKRAKRVDAAALQHADEEEYRALLLAAIIGGPEEVEPVH